MVLNFDVFALTPVIQNSFFENYKNQCQEINKESLYFDESARLDIIRNEYKNNAIDNLDFIISLIEKLPFIDINITLTDNRFITHCSIFFRSIFIIYKKLNRAKFL